MCDRNEELNARLMSDALMRQAVRGRTPCYPSADRQLSQIEIDYNLYSNSCECTDSLQRNQDFSNLNKYYKSQNGRVKQLSARRNNAVMEDES